MKAIHFNSNIKLVILFTFGSIYFLNAQDKLIKTPNKVTSKDFSVTTNPKVDNNSNALVLFSIGSTEFEGNTKGDFTLVYKETKRVLIKNRNAFDFATIKVPIYLGGSMSEEEQFVDFQASTYNLENGEIIETKLDKASLFKEKYNEYYLIKKFTFPNLKEGSIIEYKFTIKSPYYEYLRNWQFQEEYPVLWSQYQVTIPPMFNYIKEQKGNLNYTIDSISNIFKTYSIIESNSTSSSNFYTVSGNATVAIWAIKNIPAIKDEDFCYSNKNYVSKISFNLQSIKYSEDNTKYIIKNWLTTSTEILKLPGFQSIKENNIWMNNELSKIISGANNQEEIARKVYAYIRDNYSCTDHNSFKPTKEIKQTFNTKSGNVADINLLLIAMLHHLGMEIDPIILSTRDNGVAYEAMPILKEYNYVIAKLKLDSGTYLLDASHNRLGFGKIVLDCFNGSGRIINSKRPILINLSADSIIEKSNTSIFIFNDSLQGSIGKYSKVYGNNSSIEFREKFAKGVKIDFDKEISRSYTSYIKTKNIQIDSLNLYDEPIGVQYDLQFKFGDNDIVYFNPFLSEGITKNPFPLAERIFPVEMPYIKKYIYSLNMDIPKGYMVDELPKSARANLNESDGGVFEYLISKNSEKIQLRCKLFLNKTFYNSEDYSSLRDFFGYIIKKEAEQIVFKKIK